ncbi:Aste57867_13315 [Aphanomyces stellatus]|uniref:Aste57867_13315 protein n=1 Tax=Aphanomyces stellatus TaxID=120398 RepID=A0A485KXT8_9STRA|nr:hypothetical protein As57867_013266 [Aphanomyces stellatus]VFT90154.1 Aste57867_13315 [Aphanomyces stellatus]
MTQVQSVVVVEDEYSKKKQWRRGLLHKPVAPQTSSSSLDLVEQVRLACMERDVAMDEAASALVAAKFATDECDALKAMLKMKPAAAVAKPRTKSRPTTSVKALMLNLDFVLGVLRDRLGLNVHTADLKHHVLQHATSCQGKGLPVFKTVWDELRDVYAQLAQRPNDDDQHHQQRAADTECLWREAEGKWMDEKARMQTRHDTTEAKLADELDRCTKALTEERNVVAQVRAQVIAATAPQEQDAGAMQAKIQRLTKTLAAQDDAVRALEAQVATERATTAALVDALQQRQHEVSEWKAQCAAAESQVNGLHETIEWLQDGWDEAKARAIHWENESRKGDGVAEALKDQVTQLQAATDALEQMQHVIIQSNEAKLVVAERTVQELKARVVEMEAAKTASLETTKIKIAGQLAMHVRHWKRHHQNQNVASSVVA